MKLWRIAAEVGGAMSASLPCHGQIHGGVPASSAAMIWSVTV
jgi:hypothetical protein